MTAVSVTEDLTDITLAQENNANGWAELTATGYTDINGQGDATNFFIEGTQCVAFQYTRNGAARGGAAFNNTTTFTVPTDGAILVWMWWIAPTSLDTFANQGMFTVVGSGLGDFEAFTVTGSDFRPNPTGGWYCFAFDPNSATADDTQGTPTGFQYVGGGITSGRQDRGTQHFAIDAIRVGRCSSIIQGGTTPDAAAVFSDISDTLQPISNQFGVFDAGAGIFEMQGRLQLGVAGTGNEVRFIDSNKTINIRSCPKVGANFHQIDIVNAASVVTLTGCTFTNTGAVSTVATNASRGDYVTTDAAATVTLTDCGFNDMGTFDFGSGATLSGTAFRRCETVTQNGSSMTNCTFRDTISDVALVSTSTTANNIVSCEFVGDGTSHAVNLGTVSTSNTIAWTSTQSGTYAGTDQGPNASTTSGDSETILVNVASGQTLTINIDADADPPSVRNTGPGSVVKQNSRELLITNVFDDTEIRLFTNPALTALGGCEDVSNTSTYTAGFEQVSGPDAQGRYNLKYVYDYTTDIDVFVVAHSLQYEYLRLETTLTNSGGSLQINQSLDRQYENP